MDDFLEKSFKEYLFNEHNPHELMRILQRVAKLSKAALRQSLDFDFESLENISGSKRRSIFTRRQSVWMNLHARLPRHKLNTPYYYYFLAYLDTLEYPALNPYLLEHKSIRSMLYG
jgi:hypothetical protein